ncbi:MAG: hypothetical protein MZW92_80435 [Comamonadaceae bacterium]|nr:hypothetical protein [Comamonadaceae bacterium]
MRLSLRFIIPLFLALAGVAYALVPLVDQLTLKWFVRDLDIRVDPGREHRAGTAAGDVSPAAPRPRMIRFFNKIIQDERLYAIGYCESASRPARSPRRPIRRRWPARTWTPTAIRRPTCFPAPRVRCMCTIKDLQNEGATMRAAGAGA